MFDKFKQLKELRDQAKQMKEALSKETVSVTAAGGAISMTMNGNQEVQSVTIDPLLLQVERKTDLEAGLTEAFNDGVKQSQRLMAQKVQSMEGFNLPGLQ